MYRATSHAKTILLGLLVVGMLSGYILFQARHLLIGPVLTITTPASGTHVTQEMVSISGETQNATKVLLNDRPIFTDETGSFTEHIILPMGYTIVTVAAVDRFGRTTTTHIELVHQPAQINELTYNQ